MSKQHLPQQRCQDNIHHNRDVKTTSISGEMSRHLSQRRYQDNICINGDVKTTSASMEMSRQHPPQLRYQDNIRQKSRQYLSQRRCQDNICLRGDIKTSQRRSQDNICLKGDWKHSRLRAANHPNSSCQSEHHNIPCKKPNKKNSSNGCHVCLTSQRIAAECSNWRFSDKTSKISTGVWSLMTADTSHNQMKPITFMSMLESDSDYGAVHQSTQNHMVVRLKGKTRALSSAWNSLYSTITNTQMVLCMLHNTRKQHTANANKQIKEITLRQQPANKPTGGDLSFTTVTNPLVLWRPLVPCNFHNPYC